MFRGDAKAYTTDAMARQVAIRAIENGADRRVDPALRSLLYMPLNHSEDLADQERCVALFSLTDDPEGLKYALHHAAIIRRFGRFPHRNPLLGRAMMAEEQAFLDGGGYSP
jgi:uncharacterized protein (DUF924 family)